MSFSVYVETSDVALQAVVTWSLFIEILNFYKDEQITRLAVLLRECLTSDSDLDWTMLVTETKAVLATVGLMYIAQAKEAAVEVLTINPIPILRFDLFVVVSNMFHMYFKKKHFHAVFFSEHVQIYVCSSAAICLGCSSWMLQLSCFY